MRRAFGSWSSILVLLTADNDAVFAFAQYGHAGEWQVVTVGYGVAACHAHDGLGVVGHICTSDSLMSLAVGHHVAVELP